MKKTDALELLRNDHKTVRSMLEELMDTTSRAEKTRARTLEKLARELQAHTTIEEEIFYPAIREAAENTEQEQQIAEAFEEHRAVDKLVLPDLRDTDPTAIEFGGRLKVLEELVSHHIEEEEDELFETAEELLDEDQLAELGERMQARKQELLEQLSS